MIDFMRTARLLGTGRSYYHVVSRVVTGGRSSRRGTRRSSGRSSATRSLLGCPVVTYCLMSNHFHLLLEVPDRETLNPLDEAGLLAVLPLLYDGDTVEGVRQELERARLSGKRGVAPRHPRPLRTAPRQPLALPEGTETACHLLHEQTPRAHRDALGRPLQKRARGGPRTSLADHRRLHRSQSGARGTRGQAGGLPMERLCRGLRGRTAGPARSGGPRPDPRRGPAGSRFPHDWRRTAARYRVLLYQEGCEIVADAESGQPHRRGFAESDVETVVAQGGTLPVRKILRQTGVRYFCDGAVLGTAEFVNAVFEREQNRFGRKRTTGARRMRGADWGELRCCGTCRRT